MAQPGAWPGRWKVGQGTHGGRPATRPTRAKFAQVQARKKRPPAGNHAGGRARHKTLADVALVQLFPKWKRLTAGPVHGSLSIRDRVPDSAMFQVPALTARGSARQTQARASPLPLGRRGPFYAGLSINRPIASTPSPTVAWLALPPTHGSAPCRRCPAGRLPCF